MSIKLAASEIVKSAPSMFPPDPTGSASESTNHSLRVAFGAADCGIVLSRLEFPVVKQFSSHFPNFPRTLGACYIVACCNSHFE